MKIDELQRSVDGGSRPVVEFTKGIESLETYFETGMRARLDGITVDTEEDGETVYRLEFSFEDFIDFNRAVEKPIYFDQDGEPTQTASEAGWVPSNNKESIFLGDAEDFRVQVEQFFSFINDSHVDLYQEFKKEDEVSYVQWLERIVIAQRQQP